MSVRKENKEILYMEPIEKQLLWGKESWKICAHDNGDCRIKTANYQGTTLSRLWKERPEVFGNSKEETFPLLVKTIHAKEDLSIQVHPDDAYARKNEKGSRGKMECWYILDCGEDARLILGHHAANQEELREMVLSGRWRELLREVSVKKGDFIRLEPGTLHAIKGKVELLEIQQNSDITYRIHDYERLSGGKPRKLHLQQGLEVITAPAQPVEYHILPDQPRPANQMNELISCDYFTIWKIEVEKKAVIDQKYPFLVVCVIEGEGRINEQQIQKGDYMILPAGYGEAVLQGDMQILLTTEKRESGDGDDSTKL